MFKPCVVIPVYNHEHAVDAVVHGVLAQNLSCIIVDDGSLPGCARMLDALVAGAPTYITLIRHPVNRGKGSAVLTGARYAVPDGGRRPAPGIRYSALSGASGCASAGAHCRLSGLWRDGAIAAVLLPVFK